MPTTSQTFTVPMTRSTVSPGGVVGTLRQLTAFHKSAAQISMFQNAGKVGWLVIEYKLS